MALYKLVIKKQVRKKDLPKIPTKTRLKIVETIGDLRHNPRPKTASKLTNRPEYRLRQSNWRILYVIDEQEKLVEVLQVKHRGEAYKR